MFEGKTEEELWKLYKKNKDPKIREYERALPIGAQIAEHGIPL